MNNALSYPKLVNQAADCDSFWRDTEKVHPALTNMEQHASNLKIATECNSKNGKKTEDKHSFVNDSFVSIFNGKESKIRSLIKLTKHLAIPRSTRYNYQ